MSVVMTGHRCEGHERANHRVRWEIGSIPASNGKCDHRISPQLLCDKSFPSQASDDVLGVVAASDVGQMTPNFART